MRRRRRAQERQASRLAVAWAEALNERDDAVAELAVQRDEAAILRAAATILRARSTRPTSFWLGVLCRVLQIEADKCERDQRRCPSIAT